MTRNELLSSPGYWEEKIQTDLYNEIQSFIDKEGLSRSALAERLGFTKSYVTQVLNGNSDHRISKLVDLALSIGRVPFIQYKNLNQVIYEDEKDICHPRSQPYRLTKMMAQAYWHETVLSDNQDFTLTGTRHYRTSVNRDLFATT